MWLYFFARDTFSEDATFHSNKFWTANLVFTVTLSVYHLVTNIIVFIPLNTLGGTEWSTTRIRFLLNIMIKNSPLKLLS